LNINKRGWEEGTFFNYKKIRAKGIGKHRPSSFGNLKLYSGEFPPLGFYDKPTMTII